MNSILTSTNVNLPYTVITVDCFRTSLLKQTEDKENLRSNFSRIYNDLSLYFMSIFSTGFHDYPAFHDLLLMRLHVLQTTGSISKPGLSVRFQSCRVNITSRRGIKQLGISSGFIFILFSNEISRRPHS